MTAKKDRPERYFPGRSPARPTTTSAVNSVRRPHGGETRQKGKHHKRGRGWHKGHREAERWIKAVARLGVRP